MAATLPFTQWFISLHGRGTRNFVLKLRPPAKNLHVNAADLWPAQPCCLQVGAGIKPTSIVSYNHLGNNDGMNLSAPQTFRSKEISKSNVVDDMVASNSILYKPGEHPDHVVVIK